MKVILNYDKNTGQITDASGLNIAMWIGLNYEEITAEKERPNAETSSNQVDGEQLIRIMKIAAHISDPDKVTSL